MDLNGFKRTNKPSRILRSNAIDKIMHGRLLNWGRFLRSDDTYYKLDYPHIVPFIMLPTPGKTISEVDAEHIEYIVSTLAICEYKLPREHAFVLKVEYAEKGENFIGPVAERAKDVSRRYGIKCSVRGYYNMLYRARQAVDNLSMPL